MPVRFPVGTTAACVPGPSVITNAQGSTLYYADTNAVSSSDTALAVGAGVNRTKTTWVISAASSIVNADENAVPVLNSAWTTKGDILVATAGSSPTRLAVGTDTKVLTADSTAATGIKWN